MHVGVDQEVLHDGGEVTRRTPHVDGCARTSTCWPTARRTSVTFWMTAATSTSPAWTLRRASMCSRWASSATVATRSRSASAGSSSSAWRSRVCMAARIPANVLRALWVSSSRQASRSVTSPRASASSELRPSEALCSSWAARTRSIIAEEATRIPTAAVRASATSVVAGRFGKPEQLGDAHGRQERRGRPRPVLVAPLPQRPDRHHEPGERERDRHATGSTSWSVGSGEQPSAFAQQQHDRPRPWSREPSDLAPQMWPIRGVAAQRHGHHVEDGPEAQRAHAAGRGQASRRVRTARVPAVAEGREIPPISSMATARRPHALFTGDPPLRQPKNPGSQEGGSCEGPDHGGGLGQRRR